MIDRRCWTRQSGLTPAQSHTRDRRITKHMHVTLVSGLVLIAGLPEVSVHPLPCNFSCLERSTLWCLPSARKRHSHLHQFDGNRHAGQTCMSPLWGWRFCLSNQTIDSCVSRCLRLRSWMLCSCTLLQKVEVDIKTRSRSCNNGFPQPHPTQTGIKTATESFSVCSAHFIDHHKGAALVAHAAVCTLSAIASQVSLHG